MSDLRRVQWDRDSTNRLTINAMTTCGTKDIDDLCYHAPVPTTDRIAEEFFDQLERNTNEEVDNTGCEHYLSDHLTMPECGLVGPVILLGGRYQGDFCLLFGSTESATGHHRYDGFDVPNDYEVTLSKQYGLNNGSNDPLHAIDDIHGGGWTC